MAATFPTALLLGWPQVRCTLKIFSRNGDRSSRLKPEFCIKCPSRITRIDESLKPISISETSPPSYKLGTNTSLLILWKCTQHVKICFTSTSFHFRSEFQLTIMLPVTHILSSLLHHGTEKPITKVFIALFGPRRISILEFRLLAFNRDKPFSISYDPAFPAVCCQVCDFQILCSRFVKHIGCICVIPPLLNGLNIGEHSHAEVFGKTLIPDFVHFSRIGGGGEIKPEIWFMRECARRESHLRLCCNSL
jgi:hypothetical protein